MALITCYECDRMASDQAAAWLRLLPSRLPSFKRSPFSS